MAGPSVVFDTIALFASSRRNGNTGMSAYDCEHRNRDDDFEPLMKRVLGFGLRCQQA
jgi:hypothetical protein